MVGNSGAMLKVKALSSISIEDVEIAVGDADQSTAPKVIILSCKFHVKFICNFPKLINSET